MKNLIKQQQGSFFAEVGAVITSIAVLTLISSAYMDSTVGRAQASEGFMLAQPIIKNVNDFYAAHGKILFDSTATSAGNYPAIDVYDNSAGGNVPNDYAGRFVQDVQSYTNGVVQVKFNEWHNDSTVGNHEIGQVSNVQSAITGEMIFFIPFLIGETDSTPYNAAENTSLRWGCATTIDAHPPTGSTIGFMSATDANEQYFYAPGCVVISPDQAACLNPAGTAITIKGTASTACTNTHTGPVNWNDGIYSTVDNS